MSQPSADDRRLMRRHLLQSAHWYGQRRRRTGRAAVQKRLTPQRDHAPLLLQSPARGGVASRDRRSPYPSSSPRPGVIPCA
jgi:hypothetical protein